MKFCWGLVSGLRALSIMLKRLLAVPKLLQLLQVMTSTHTSFLLNSVNFVFEKCFVILTRLIVSIMLKMQTSLVNGFSAWRAFEHVVAVRLMLRRCLGVIAAFD